MVKIAKSGLRVALERLSLSAKFSPVMGSNCLTSSTILLCLSVSLIRSHP